MVSLRHKKVDGLVKEAQEILQDDATFKRQFIQAFKALNKFVLDIQENNAKEIKSISVLSKDEFSSMKTKTDNEFLILSSKLQAFLKNAQQRIDSVKDGVTPIKGIDFFDGISPDERDVIKKVLKQIPKTEVLSGTQMIKSLNISDTKGKIKKERVEGLEDIEKAANRKQVNIGAAVIGRDIITTYDLSPFLDGSTKVFSLPANWTIVSVDGSSFPWRYRRYVDYTFTPQQITFTSEITASSSLAAGQTVELIYVSS